MDGSRFDGLAQAMGGSSRRVALKTALGGAALAAAGLLGLGGSEARKNKRHKKMRKKCPSGSLKLTNNTCAETCATVGAPTAPGCGCSNANSEGRLISIVDAGCDALTIPCSATTDCPRGQTCVPFRCSGKQPFLCAAVCAP